MPIPFNAQKWISILSASAGFIGGELIYHGVNDTAPFPDSRSLFIALLSTVLSILTWHLIARTIHLRTPLQILGAALAAPFLASLPLALTPIGLLVKFWYYTVPLSIFTSIGVAWIVAKYSNDCNNSKCHNCGYNLRGAQSGICPECGYVYNDDYVRHKVYSEILNEMRSDSDKADALDEQSNNP